MQPGTWATAVRARCVLCVWQLHVELFGTPIAGAPYPCTVMPAPTNAAKSVVSGLLGLVKAGEPMCFQLRTRDRYGNFRWSGGDLVR